MSVTAPATASATATAPTLQELVSWCDERTRRTAFRDAPGAFNGLQLANDGRVTRIGAAVDAGVGPFRAATAAGVDFLIVHHGMYWTMPQPLTGPVYERVATLFRGNCALYSSHLPLDGHEDLGNNALLARQLGLEPLRPFMTQQAPGGESIGRIAAFDGTRADLRARLETHYARVTAIECGSERPRAVAFCSGSGNSAIPALAAEGVDTLVTGELREEWYSHIQEHRLNVWLCGHYATEVHGVQALARELSLKFGLPWQFIATNNPL
ncbi:MAG: Nif3-like dinuclear metal center hexameric protein [Opitutaceae bacterium]|jgi:dinuclear metal center YbgI/SA1388 family protein|nr:Nif3-like dinuclear metal center hexameric protein [Opitutaceae bacterium]